MTRDRHDQGRTEADYKPFVDEIEAACGGGRRLDETFFAAVRMMALAMNKACVVDAARAEAIEAEWQRLRDTFTDEQYTHVVEAFAILAEALGERREEFLGHVMEDCLNATNQRAGQFLTPVDVSAVMAQCLTAPPPPREDYIISINDPCCGAGVLLVECAESLMRAGWKRGNIYIDAGDIDPHAVDMCYVQLSLLGYPAIVRHENALTREVLSPPRLTIGYFLHGTEWRLRAQRRRKAEAEQTGADASEEQADAPEQSTQAPAPGGATVQMELAI